MAYHSSQEGRQKVSYKGLLAIEIGDSLDWASEKMEENFPVG